MQETQEMWVQPLGWEDPLEKEMATHSSILKSLENPTDKGAWRATAQHSMAQGSCVCVCVCVCVYARARAQVCPTLCDPVDHSPPGSSVHGIPQARILEWIAMPFSRWSFRSEIEPSVQSQVSCIVRGYFTREAHSNLPYIIQKLESHLSL